MTGYNCTLVVLASFVWLLNVCIIFLSLGIIYLKLMGDLTVLFNSIVNDSFLGGVATASSVCTYIGLLG